MLDNTMTSTAPHTGQHLVLAGDAVLRWTHRAGSPVYCLARFRGLTDTGQPPARMVVVLSELRGRPRGHHLMADISGAATATVEQLLPAAADPTLVDWYAQHGSFSSWDPTGPDTLTHVTLAWDGTRYQPPVNTHARRLLTTDEARELTAQLQLAPVADAIAPFGWPDDRPTDWPVGEPSPA